MPMWGRACKHHRCLAHSAHHHSVLEAETSGHSKASLGYVQVVTHYYGLLPFCRALWISRKSFNSSPPPPPFPSSFFLLLLIKMKQPCLHAWKFLRQMIHFSKSKKSCFETCQLDVAVRDPLTLF